MRQVPNPLANVILTTFVEEWKWAKATSPGTPVWSHGGIVCTGETYKRSQGLPRVRFRALSRASSRASRQVP
jgi:hypothetical protein